MSRKMFESANHVELYRNTRSKVPKQLNDYILNYLREKIEPNNWKIVVDVGCGNGQCTNNLGPYFQNVYGFDISEAQLEVAKQLNTFHNIHYGISAAENLKSIESNSVQLITAAAAAHWFDLKRFFVEVDRVLVPDGVVALISYKLYKPVDPKNPNDERMGKLIRDSYYDPKMMQYFDQNVRDLCDNHYLNLKFPDNYDYVYKDGFIVSDACSGQFVIDKFKSISLYQRLLENHKHECEEFISSVETKLRSILSVNDLSHYELLNNTEFFIAMGRKLN